MKGFVLTALALAAMPAAQAATVYSTNFTTLSPEIAPGTAALTGAQGYAGLGPVGSAVSGNFLRSAPGNTVTLTLTGLAAHTNISLGFFFAAIDSLDGSGTTTPYGDYFKITLDGNTLFRESFANAVADQVQSFVPASPSQVYARHQDLGFTTGPGSFYTDSGYWLGGESALTLIPHTSSTAVFTFVLEGPGIEALDNESWAIDNLTVNTNAVPLPAAAWLLLGGVAALGSVARRRQARGANA